MHNTCTPPAPLSARENTLWNMSGCIFYLGCQWLTTILVVVFSAGFDNSGALAFAMSVGNMFASVSLYKIRTFQVSDIQNDYSSGDYIGFRVFTISASLIVSTAYIALISNNPLALASSLFYLLFKADETFVDVLYGIDQKHGRMDYIGQSQFIRGAATLIGFTVPIALTDNLLYAIIGMTVLCACTTIFFDIKRTSRFGSVYASFSRAQITNLAKACLLPTVANFCATSIVSIARQRYGILEGEELLGIYASIATPAVLVQAGAAYLYSPLIGSISSTLHKRGIAAFKKSVLKILLLLIACMGVVIGLLSAFGPQILLGVFGAKLSPYVWIFPFALLSTTTVAILLYINDALLILRDGITQVVINAIALTITALFANNAISLWGMNGVNLLVICATTIAGSIGLFKILSIK